MRSPQVESTALLPPTATSHPEPRQPVSRLALLDGLRLGAALFVLLFHYVGMNPSHWGVPLAEAFPHLHPIAAYGWTGVQLFFLISGFVICMSSWGRPVGDFFISRAARLYPAYWFAIIATTTVISLTPALPELVERRTWSELLLNLTMVHEPLHVHSVDPPYWTLWVELRFYLLFALVVWRGLTYRRVITFCALWTVGSLLASGTGHTVLGYVFMPQHSPYFIAGIAFYLMYRFGPSLPLWGLVGVSWAQGLHYLHGHFSLPVWEVGAAFVTGYFLLIAAIAHGLFAQVRGRWLVVAGSLTYPLYLFHQSIGWIAIEKLRHILPSGTVLLIVTTAMLAFAWLVHQLVERPLTPVVKRLLRSGIAQMRSENRIPAQRYSERLR